MTKGLRVVHLTSAHPPFDIRIFHKECRSLAEAGYNVTLIASHEREETIQGVHVLPIPKPKSRLHRMSRTVSQAYQVASRLQADMYHFHDPELIPVGLLLKHKGYRVVYDAHEDAPRSLLSSGRDYLPRRIQKPTSWLLEHLENTAARRFSAIVAATPAIARRFVRLNQNTVTINNYPHLHELVSQGGVAWNDRKLAVAFVGVISKIRGLQQMVEAVALANVEVKARLILAGNHDSPSCHTQASHLNGWQYTEELGFINRLEVTKLLGTVRAGLVVYHPAPNHIEAQPNKLFEYMSAGIPVIASDFPLWRQLIEQEKCGLLVDPLNPVTIAEAITYIISHPAEAEAMGRRGREAVERKYNWAVEEQNLLNLYDNL